ncbi:MAG: DUF1365 family protein [Rhodospirillales bacterium]|nr:DUF1365 family protein [Rhodospirillales bacterium]
MNGGSDRSGLYIGDVVHQRVKPRRHRLRYRVLSLLLDLDDIDAAAGRLRLFSRNRFNLYSFYDRDHGNGAGAPIRERVIATLSAAGIDVADGSVQVLCYPRVLGYVFNPLSVYFCRRRDGVLAAILYEVSNTFGERHSYLIPVGDGSGKIIRQSCAKRLYVSPFFAVDGEYRFRVKAPSTDGERVAIGIDYRDDEGTRLYASFQGKRRPLNDRTLLVYAVRLPLLTFKVIAGIHWEALKLWLKGIPLVRRPSPPPEPVSIVHPTAP